MEDAHAAVLTLEDDPEEKNAFFGVYDGHGGNFLPCLSSSFSLLTQGSTVAKFAGINVHKRLLSEESYREKRYDEAMKRAFLGTDEDLLAGTLLYHRSRTVADQTLKTQLTRAIRPDARLSLPC